MFKRILLWAGMNIAVIAVITIILKITGLDTAISGGRGYGPMLLACAVVGFAGSIISLLMSKSLVKRTMGVHIIESPQSEFEAWYVNIVKRQAEMLGINTPEIGIFDSPEPNAFATGASRNNSLVAISTGLMSVMNKDEIEAVVGHEMAHVANGDMVTMALLQGVLNTFVVFFSRIIAEVVASRGNSEGNATSSGVYFITTLVLQVVFGFLAQIIASWFSRHREFRADAGGAKLTSNQQMANALDALRRRPEMNQDLPGEFAAFGFTGSIRNLFSTHPPLEKRIEALLAADQRG
ncbi:protease HtpX [Ignatzschineria ureiclastica]|uniref:Protease HtpX n=1 Tax=Ignatzschineria ureiclastica TaxID=472582 RepID=A0A2U2AGS2_9GAMM|nr:protease HtpX [Ignatzschineria ureiclastica]PWD81840.1 protease HtpX [Ignatzschineria ureiclastica]GGZ90847.1 protease HtpX [Ignatzschineria ureiclastica]